MNIKFQGTGSLLQRSEGLGLKSVKERQKRQEKCESQIVFYENQIENLKHMECGSLEEIARKLDMFHSYEDQIAAVKAAYNQEQMMHILDEAREKGEKIAEKAEELEPKTAEERKEELAEEALGTEENEGVLEEVLEETEEIIEKTAENLEETTEDVTEAALEAADKMAEADEASKEQWQKQMDVHIDRKV